MVFELCSQHGAIINASEWVLERDLQGTLVLQRIAQRIDQGAEQHFQHLQLGVEQGVGSRKSNLAQGSADQIQLIGIGIQFARTVIYSDLLHTVPITHRHAEHHASDLAGEAADHIAGMEARLQGIGDPQLGGVRDDVVVALHVDRKRQNLIHKSAAAPGFRFYHVLDWGTHRVSLSARSRVGRDHQCEICAN